MKISVTKQQARRFLLQKQLLLPPQALKGPHAVEAVFDTLRLIQYDPLNPCGRNTDLVLQSRISDYHPEDYYNWLYNQKKGIECYDKELCIIPIEDFPLVNHRQLYTHSHPYWKDFIKANYKEIQYVQKLLEEKGPLTASDIDIKKMVEGNWSENATFGRVALDILWRTGRAVIAKREKGRKYYAAALTLGQHNLPEGDKKLVGEHILRRINSVGLLKKSGTEEGWQGLRPTKDKTALVEQLIKDNKLIEIEIKESKKSYVALASDLSKLEAKIKAPSQGPAVFLAPLDNLIWDRALIHDIFGFFYRWEVYTPLSKRKFGYYVLPILFEDRIIGQIEPILNKEKKLQIKGLWKEQHEPWGELENTAVQNAILKFQEYLHAKDIIYNSKDLI